MREEGEQHLGDEEVDKDDEHRGVDDGLNGGAAHALGASGGSHAIEAADGGDDVAEEERLDQSLDDVGIAEVLPGHGEVLGAVLVIHEDGDEAAADDAEGVGDDGEEEEHGDAGEDARRDQLAHGVDAEGAHGVDLLGDDHGAEFAGHGGGVAAGDHDAGEHRAEFADHGEADELAGDGGGAELRERGRRLQGQHAAGEEAGEQHDGDGTDADDVGLHEEVGPVDGRAKEVHDRRDTRTGNSPAR